MELQQPVQQRKCLKQCAQKQKILFQQMVPVSSVSSENGHYNNRSNNNKQQTMVDLLFIFAHLQ